MVPPGYLVNFQFPDAGKPLKITLAVAVVQVGCVIVSTTGSVGVTGCAFIVTLGDANEVHPFEFVTVKV